MEALQHTPAPQEVQANVGTETGKSKSTYMYDLDLGEKVTSGYRRQAGIENLDREQTSCGHFVGETLMKNAMVSLACYSMIISLGGLIFGYDIGTIGGLVDMPLFVSAYGDQDLGNGNLAFSPITKGTIVSISSLGGFFSGFVAAKIIPKIGMKHTICLSLVFYCSGNLVTLFSTSWKTILLGRVTNGVALGLLTITCPLYISDITPVKSRGVFTCFNQVFVTIGIVLGSLSILASATDHYPALFLQYQYPLIQGCIVSFVGALLILLVPESPAWLVKNDRSIRKIKKSLSKITALPLDSECIVNQTTQLFDLNYQAKLDTSLANEKRNDSIINGKPKYFFRVVTGILIYFFQQFTGINFFFFYGLTIFENVKLQSPYLIPVIFAVFNMCFSGISIYTISIFQRRALLLFGSTMLTIFMVLFSIFGTALKEYYDTSVTLVVLSCSFISTFGLTWGPVCATIISELFPANIKVKAMSMCGSSAWIFNFAIALLIPLLTEKIHLGVGAIFAGVTFIGGVFVYMFVPETKDRSTQELDQYYRNNGYRIRKRIS